MMEYDARKQSLLSEQQSEKVEIYFIAKNTSFSVMSLTVSLQETNQAKKLLMKSKKEYPNSHQQIQFSQTLVIDYFFQVRQKLIIQVHQNQGQPKAIVQATVGEIFNGRNKGIIKPINSQNQFAGQLHLRCQKVQRGNNKYLDFDIVCRNVDVGYAFLCFGQNDCSFRLYKIKNNEQYLLYESEVQNGGNNKFKHLRISQKRLSNNNPNQPIIIRFYNGGNKALNIGQAKLDMAMLVQGKTRFTLTKNGKERGIANFENVKQSIKYEFMDYLQNGMQMAMVVCIDFTASNGIQARSDSLHYISAHKKSPYQQALNEVCNIVLDYDTDKLVPTFGFGAKVNLPNFNTYNKVHHCFPINGSDTNPNLFQIEGILKGYREALPHLSFSGPTLFAPLLRQAMGVCQGMKDQIKEYMILLILTDGIIHDKEQVKDLLVKCGRLPLSVIIIGIGNNQDWSAMHELDDDDCQMTDLQGNKTQRDLVQFVQFSKHNNNGVQLARQVLQELPRQVEEYHNLVGLTPIEYQKNLISDIVYQQSNKLR